MNIAKNLNINLSDNANITTMVVQRVFASHCLVLTILFALFVAYFILRYTILEILILISCRRGKAERNLLTKAKEGESILNGKSLLKI